MIRVAMEEDHPIMRTGLARIVDSLHHVELVAAVEPIEDLPPMFPPPDVVLLDLRLPSCLTGPGRGPAPGRPRPPVLVVTGEDTGIDEMADAVAAGAQGYLPKEAGTAEYGACLSS